MDADRIADRVYVLPSESATLALPPNVLAGLGCIRACEGTAGPNGYRMLFGGGLFDDLADHPNIAFPYVDKNGVLQKTTAAGAYQITHPTWASEIQPALSLPDFTPPSQDAAALFLIRLAGAYDALVAGDLRFFIDRCARRWASLPASTYAQPKRSWDYARVAFTNCGGVLA